MSTVLQAVTAPLLRPSRAAAASFGAVLVGTFVGVALAADVPSGVALLLGACYMPLVFLNLPLAIVLWIPLVFLEGIPSFNLGAKAAGLLLVIGWLSLVYTGDIATSVLRRHRRLLETLLCLLVWVTLSLAWAPEIDRAFGSAWQWWAVATIFLVVATCVKTDAVLRLAVAAFVAGSTLAVLSGFVVGDPTAAGAATTRFSGGSGDPNFLASGLVPGIVLAGGLLAVRKSAVWRWAMLTVIAFLALGVVMSESRGAAVASVVTVAAALIVFKRRRVYVVALVLVAVGFAVVAFTLVPGSWERVSRVGESGPRGEIWTVAWRAGKDHALAGVGTSNFPAVAGDYVREPGGLEYVRAIAEDTKVVHNLYLQLFAENGLIGLTLFLVVVAGCLRAAWLAAKEFRASGLRDLETLALSIFVAQIAILSTAVFLSSQVDKRLWILLAFGPAALEVSRRVSPRTAA